MDPPMADNINKVAEGPACVFGGQCSGSHCKQQAPAHGSQHRQALILPFYR